MIRRLPLNANSLAAAGQRIGRSLEILVIPIVGFSLMAQSLYRFDVGVDIWIVASTLVYSIFWTGDYRVDPLNWIDWTLFAVISIEIICYFRSTYQPNSVHGFKEILFLFLFYCFVRLHLRQKDQQVGIFLLMTLFGFFLSVAAVVLFYRQYSNLKSLGFDDVTNFKRFFSFFQPTYPVGEWITIYLMFLPFPLILFINTASKAGWWLLCPFVTILIAISATFSRGLYIAVFTFFVTATFLSWLYNVTSLKRLVTFNACALLLLFCILGFTPLRQPIMVTTSLLRTTSQIRSLEGRADLWKETWRIVKDHPFFGVGSYNFPMQYSAYKGEDFAYAGRTFNIFLQILVEKGAIGLLAYCLLFFSFFRVSNDRIRLLADDEFQKTVIVLFMATCVALIVRDLSYSSLLTNKGVSALLWFIFANNAGPKHNPKTPQYPEETKLAESDNPGVVAGLTS